MISPYTSLEVFLLGGYMRENKMDKLLTTKPSMLMIKSKDISKGLDLKITYPEKAITRRLSVADKTKLLDSIRKDTTLFLEQIIDWHLKGEEILNFIKGDSRLLPPSYQRFYDECVVISTRNYQLYITDKAIEKCSEIVYKLSERSKKDSFSFVKGKLEIKDASHLYISLGYDNGSGRSVWYEGGKENFLSGIIYPYHTVCYSAYAKEDGTYDEDDINNILLLIEEFTKNQGLFSFGKNNDTDLVMYNRGSMKIQGIDKDKRIKEKVLTLMEE